jgi:hypothetical protein
MNEEGDWAFGMQFVKGVEKKGLVVKIAAAGNQYFHRQSSSL